MPLDAGEAKGVRCVGSGTRRAKIMNLDVVLYVAVAITLYIAAVQLVALVERRVGRQFGNRQLVFTLIFLVLLVVGLRLSGFHRLAPWF